MKIVLQRVSRASVRVIAQSATSSSFEPQSIGLGLMLLVGVSDDDDEQTVEWMAHKIAQLRIFEDASGKMNLSVQDVQGAILSISQFTLYGDTHKGNRPSFMAAGKPEHAQHIWNELNQALRSLGLSVATGKFASHMAVDIINDGPVTLILER